MLKRKTVICSGVSSAPDNIRLKDYDIVLQHQQQNDLGGGGVIFVLQIASLSLIE